MLLGAKWVPQLEKIDNYGRRVRDEEKRHTVVDYPLFACRKNNPLHLLAGMHHV